MWKIGHRREIILAVFNGSSLVFRKRLDSRDKRFPSKHEDSAKPSILEKFSRTTRRSAIVSFEQKSLTRARKHPKLVVSADRPLVRSMILKVYDE